MYEYLTGKLVSIQTNYIVLEVSGIGYCLYVANPFAFQDQLQAVATIYVYQAVREDAISLYGFASQAEKSLFLQLIGVSGIGPKSALAILANGDHEGLVNAISSNDVSYLTKFPGVGKKTAGQIILDLKDKLAPIGPSVAKSTAPVDATASHILDQVEQALLGLGYSAKEVAKVLPILSEGQFKDTSAALKEAFRLLLGKK